MDGLPPGRRRAFAEAGGRRHAGDHVVEIKDDKATGHAASMSRSMWNARRISPTRSVPGSRSASSSRRRRSRPAVLALRDDFPAHHAPERVPAGHPFSLCIDDRPWPEARLTYTPADFSRLIQLWLAKAARGELHDPAQPPDPLFYAALGPVLPRQRCPEQRASARVRRLHAPDNGRVRHCPAAQQAPPGVSLCRS